MNHSVCCPAVTHPARVCQWEIPVMSSPGMLKKRRVQAWAKQQNNPTPNMMSVLSRIKVDMPLSSSKGKNWGRRRPGSLKYGAHGSSKSSASVDSATLKQTVSPAKCNQIMMLVLAPKWVRLVGPNCTDIWSEKVLDLSHFGPIWPTLSTYDMFLSNLVGTKCNFVSTFMFLSMPWVKLMHLYTSTC